MDGILQSIWIAEDAGAPMCSLAQASLLKGRGIEGDRYFSKVGTFSAALEEKGDFEVTLIEQEHVNAFNRIAGPSLNVDAFRRNLVTSGIRLNSLVGKEFYVGDVLLYGVRLCEPCAYLAGLLGNRVMEDMLHKAGLRAVIRKSGNISAGCLIYNA